ncbi:MAG: conserved rane protein of unknown function [Herbinix sp.]|jgi:hypothetical protein|nr:conserved rane protein of unknown function [Herbinix sp.]
MTLNDLGAKDWEQRMRELASGHKDVKLTRYNSILDKNNQIAYKRLNQIRDNISELSTDIISLIPAARWLFDNYQMLYREIKKFRASGTSYELLPILRSGENKGFPRIYVVAKNIVELSKGHLNEENIHAMLTAYQKEIPLTEKELWVLPELFGFCLLESIIGLSQEIIRIIRVKSKADKLIRRLQSSGQGSIDPRSLVSDIDDECKQNYSFHSHVIHLLKNMSVDEAVIQGYLDYHFASNEKRIKPSNVFIKEGKIEAHLEAEIRALIVSLREIDELDTVAFFENYSYLEAILSRDPEGVYPRLDPESKGMYRQVIVKLSSDYKVNEEVIADACLTLAVEGREMLNCSHHVGAYLLGKGFRILRAKIRNKPEPSNLDRKSRKGTIYFTSLLFVVLCTIVLYFYVIRFYGIQESMNELIMTVVALPLIVGIALELMNFIFTRNLLVKKIPSMDYLTQIPETARTFVVMPVIISNKEQGATHLDRLQKHYLANRQQNLYFALLVDYKDAAEQFLPEDKEIEEDLLRRLNELNQLYPAEHPIFSLFIRYRKWNGSEKCYMGWERKRGKLEEFNYLLSGMNKEETSYSTIVCDMELLSTFRYVITLDADTDLIRDNAAKLVGLIDHPMNHPVIDTTVNKVKEGYVIIQPSVRNHIVDRGGSHFAEIFGGQSGLVYYSTAISDIYQDIFGEGIYIGKGIYDIQAFHQLLHNVIPENKVLSHDLLESCYARTAFSSSAKVMDSFPNSVIAFAKREHRWIRGDWQLFPWLFRNNIVKGRSLCGLAKWKIFDNLRRSLVPLSKVLLIFFCLVFLPGASFLWVPMVFFSDVFNLAVMLFEILKQKLYRPKLAFVYKGLLKDIGTLFLRALFEFSITPYRAYIAADAMVRTLFRLYISRRNLLRWNTAESVDSSIINTRRGYFLTMLSSFLAAIALLLLLLTRELEVFESLIYLVTSIWWGLAYYLSYRFSQPKERMNEEIKEEDRELLLDTSRRTWQFFKELSTKENNWFCPDNYQVAKVEKVSDKTSPTNIGLQFLSILTARDLGFETLSETLTSTENLMSSVSKLPKWKGHLYNWYQIKTLEVLNPAYISTVDSGNFFGHLIALKQGLLEQLNRPIFPESLLRELRKTLELSNYEGSLKDHYERIEDFIEDVTDIWDSLQEGGQKTHGRSRWLRELADQIEGIVEEAGHLKLKGESFTNQPTLIQLVERENKRAAALQERIHRLSKQIDCLIANADFRFLYNEKRMLFHIGYHVSSQTLDGGCYDLMASESALTSFLAIASGVAPQKHWHKLGRPLTMVNGVPCFVSWSGTMFEYLMPNLVMKEYEDSVYAQTSMAAVLQHQNYAKETKIPWGISESQYYRFDLNSNYQYKAFGVPKLRLQPVRRNSLVVTPYATMLALDYAKEEGFANLRRLKDLGMYGEYGFYEAIDYNSPDAEEMTPYCIVRSFMAHHQGMNLVAINNYLNKGIMRERFHAEAMVKATESLLEEKRQSHLISIAKRGYTIKISKVYFREEKYSNRYINSVAPRVPVTNYLSNNKYSLLLTSDGDGFSSYKDMMLYRWRADRYANSGNYIYIKEMKSGKLWSTTYHPTRLEPDSYQVIFSPHQAEFKRRDGDVSTKTVISLDSNDNLEIRRVTLTNHSKEAKVFELTSYFEVVGDTHLAEISHPAFNKLFIESEFLEEQEIFLSKRRSGKKSSYPYILHMVRSEVKPCRRVEYENDRLRFLGRNHTPENPDSVTDSIPLSNQAGFCNDPIMSLRVTISVGEGEAVNISFITGVCDSKEDAIRIGQELGKTYHIDDIFEKFKLQKEIELKYLEITRAQINAFQDLISPIFYPTRHYRGPYENIRRNHNSQSSLWRFGVSGDNPILLLNVNSIEEAGIIRDVLKAYEYLKMNRVVVDLIILSQAEHGYIQELDDLVNDLTSSLRLYNTDNSRPSLFLLHSYQMIPAEIDLLMTVARVVITGKTGIYFRNLKDNLNEIIEE